MKTIRVVAAVIKAVTAPQAVGSALTGEGQIRKEVHCAGRNNTKNDCP